MKKNKKRVLKKYAYFPLRVEFSDKSKGFIWLTDYEEEQEQLKEEISYMDMTGISSGIVSEPVFLKIWRTIKRKKKI